MCIFVSQQKYFEDTFILVTRTIQILLLFFFVCVCVCVSVCVVNLSNPIPSDFHFFFFFHFNLFIFLPAALFFPSFFGEIVAIHVAVTAHRGTAAHFFGLKSFGLYYVSLVPHIASFDERKVY